MGRTHLRSHTVWAGLLNLLSAFCICIVCTVPNAAAQKDDVETSDLVDWYYGAVFGTGVYKVNNKTVMQLRVPLSFTLIPMEENKWGLNLLTPVSVGLYNYDLSGILEENISDNVGATSFLPGVELLIPMRENWTLKPFTQLGLGKEYSSGGSAWIYTLGIRSTASWFRKRREIILGNEILYAGYRTDNDVTSDLVRLGIGVNLISPLDMKIKGRDLNWGTHIIYYRYINNFESFVAEGGETDTVKISDELELAFTIGTYQPLRLFSFQMDRIGLGFLLGNHLKGVKLVAGFPF